MLIESNENKELDSLLFFLYSKLNEKKMYLNKYMAQKAIFKIKMTLGKNHALTESLPYYWYYYGPFSESVADSFNLISDYSNDLNIVLKYPEIEDIVDNLIKNKNFFYNELPIEIYKKFAPYNFQYPFKFKIFDIVDKKRNIENSDDFINDFFQCESQLPNDSYFNEYSNIFSDFLTKLDLINEEHQMGKNWLLLRNPIKELWFTFAKGLRVKQKDEFYNYNTKIWDLQFKESLKMMESYVDIMEDNLKEHSKTNNKYTLLGENILNATVGTYLRSK
ncbi:hypothetical protein [Methanobrevibacter filiformis]|uniref:Uncharacterized protein n=1 Tax=Methanobrevibacter filiformis TaxID=55758 RepID=A0A166EZT5_9EURY|nr:hypothetical protein [Methanobrevibacter filiformis]KZX17178.1 hypothetical protein MBFIL_03160 [Methanobrevibacter filiformis]